MDSQSSLPPETAVGRVCLRVAALDELVAFYRRVVGLAVIDHSDGTATLGVDGRPLLVLRGDPTVSARPPAAAGLFHTAFRVPSRAALGDALERVREHATLTGASDHLVSEALYLDDPEGNGIEIYRDYPRETWPTTTDGRIRMATEPVDLDAIASAAGGADRAPPGTVVGHVHLEVTSLPAMREFYVETLGFESQASLPDAAFVSAGGYHHHVGANTWNGRTEPATGRGLAWFELTVPSAADLESIRERVVDAGQSVRRTEGGLAVDDHDAIEVRLRAER